MYHTGKTSIIETEMRTYSLEILGLSESRWTRPGKFKVATGEMLLYSGCENHNAPHTGKSAIYYLQTSPEIATQLDTDLFQTDYCIFQDHTLLKSKSESFSDTHRPTTQKSQLRKTSTTLDKVLSQSKVKSR